MKKLLSILLTLCLCLTMVPTVFAEGGMIDEEPVSLGDESDVLTNVEMNDEVQKEYIAGFYDLQKTITYSILREPTDTEWQIDSEHNVKFIRFYTGIKIPANAKYVMLNNDEYSFGDVNGEYFYLNMRVEKLSENQYPDYVFPLKLAWYDSNDTSKEPITVNEFDVHIVFAYLSTPMPKEHIETTVKNAEISNEGLEFSLGELDENNKASFTIKAPSFAAKANVTIDRTLAQQDVDVEQGEDRVLNLEATVPTDDKLEQNYLIEWKDDNGNIVKTETLRVKFRVAVVDSDNWTDVPFKNLSINNGDAIKNVTVTVDGKPLPKEGTLRYNQEVSIDTTKMTVEDWKYAYENFSFGNEIRLPANIVFEDLSSFYVNDESGSNLLDLTSIPDSLRDWTGIFEDFKGGNFEFSIPIGFVEVIDGKVVVFPRNDVESHRGTDFSFKWSKVENNAEAIQYNNVRTKATGGEAVLFQTAFPESGRVIEATSEDDDCIIDSETTYKDGVLRYNVDIGNAYDWDNKGWIDTKIKAPDGATMAKIQGNDKMISLSEDKTVQFESRVDGGIMTQQSYSVEWYKGTEDNKELMSIETIRIEIAPVTGYVWMQEFWQPVPQVNISLTENAAKNLNENYYFNEYNNNYNGGIVIDIQNPENFSFAEMKNPQNLGVFRIEKPESAAYVKINASSGPMLFPEIAEGEQSVIENMDKFKLTPGASNKFMSVDENGNVILNQSFVIERTLTNGLKNSLTYYTMSAHNEAYANSFIIQWYDEDGNLIDRGGNVIQENNDIRGEYVFVHVNPYVIENSASAKVESENILTDPVTEPTVINLSNNGERVFTALDNLTLKHIADKLRKKTWYMVKSEYSLYTEKPEQNHEGKDFMQYTVMKLLDKDGNVINWDKKDYVMVLLPYPEGMTYEDVKDKYFYLHHYNEFMQIQEDFREDSDTLIPVPAGLLFATNSFSPFVLEAGDKSTTPTPPSGGVVPPTDNVTNDTSDKTTNADLNATVGTDGKATATVDKSTADKIVDKATENGSTEITIDISTKPGTSDSAEIKLPAETIKDLVEKTDADITIVTDTGKVTLNQAAAEAIAKAAPSGTVTLVVEKTKDESEKMQFELKIVTDNGIVKEFNGGTANVTIKLNHNLKAEEKLVCLYLDDKGKYSKVEGYKNADGTFTFVTGHFSSYIVMAEEEAEAILNAQNDKLIKGVKNTTIKAWSEAAKGYIRVNWKKSVGYKVDYFEVYKAKNKTALKDSKTPYFKTKSGTWKSYKNAKGLKKGTRYFYRVRGVRTIDGKTYYTKWSNIANRYAK